MAAPSAPKPWQSGWRRVAIAAGAALLIALRKHDSLLHPQFWAEDGAVFFLQAAVHPWSSIVTPYAGYLHLVPRLIALSWRFLPAAMLPAFYAWSALAVSGGVAWAILSPRVPLPGAWAAALAIGAIPCTGETYLNICNLQWILVIGLTALIAVRDAIKPSEYFADAILLVVLSFTGPFVIFLLPLFVLRLLIRRSRWSAILLGLAILCGAAQISRFRTFPLPPHPPMELTVHDVAAAAHRWFVFGLPFTPSPNDVEYAALGGCIFFFLVAACWMRRRKMPEVWFLFLSGFGILVGAWYKYHLYKGWDFGDVALGDRYFFSENVLLVWLAAVVALTGRAAVRRTLLAVAMVGLIINARAFVFRAAPDLNWARYARRIDRGIPTAFPVLPGGPWLLWYPGRMPSPRK